MGTTQNLRSVDAIEKIKNLIKSENIALFTTNLSHAPLSTRPMSTAQVDEQGCIWFLSKIDSDKNAEIKRDNRVQLFYSHMKSAEFLSLYGKADIVQDRAKLEELWTPIAKAWFTEGIEDPTITIIKFTPEDGHYWDTKSGKMISMLKIAVGAITGITMDNGLEGKVRI